MIKITFDKGLTMNLGNPGLQRRMNCAMSFSDSWCESVGHEGFFCNTTVPWRVSLLGRNEEVEAEEEEEEEDGRCCWLKELKRDEVEEVGEGR